MECSLLSHRRSLRHQGEVDMLGAEILAEAFSSQLAAKETTSSKYSYGWQRAEILGALINGVFLLALCFSIFMEAIERFVNGAG